VLLLYLYPSMNQPAAQSNCTQASVTSCSLFTNVVEACLGLRRSDEIDEARLKDRKNSNANFAKVHSESETVNNSRPPVFWQCHRMKRRDLFAFDRPPIFQPAVNLTLPLGPLIKGMGIHQTCKLFDCFSVFCIFLRCSKSVSQSNVPSKF